MKRAVKEIRNHNCRKRGRGTSSQGRSNGQGNLDMGTEGGSTVEQAEIEPSHNQQQRHGREDQQLAPQAQAIPPAQPGDDVAELKAEVGKNAHEEPEHAEEGGLYPSKKEREKNKSEFRKLLEEGSHQHELKQGIEQPGVLDIFAQVLEFEDDREEKEKTRELDKQGPATDEAEKHEGDERQDQEQRHEDTPMSQEPGSEKDRDAQTNGDAKEYNHPTLLAAFGDTAAIDATFAKYTPECLLVLLERDASIFIFKPESKIRIACRVITKNKIFEWFILLNIVAISIMLAVEIPSSQPWLLPLRIYFLCVFLIEFVLKVIRRGLLIYPYRESTYQKYGRPYLRIPWYWIDLLVIVTGILSFVITDAKAVGSMRVAQLLIPLRSLYSVKPLRLVIKGFLKLIPRLGQVVLLLALMLMIYAQLGVVMFAGRFHQYCTDGYTIFTNATYPDGVLCGYITCEDYGPDLSCAKSPLNSTEPFQAPDDGYTNYDNILWALLNLFTAVTLEGWSSQAYYAMATTSPWSCLFFVSLVILGAYILLNTFVSIIADTYTEVLVESKEVEVAKDLSEDDCGVVKGEDETHTADMQPAEEHSVPSGLNGLPETTGSPSKLSESVRKPNLSGEFMSNGVVHLADHSSQVPVASPSSDASQKSLSLVSSRHEEGSRIETMMAQRQSNLGMANMNKPVETEYSDLDEQNLTAGFVEKSKKWSLKIQTAYNWLADKFEFLTPIRLPIERFMSNLWFEIFLFVVIIANTVVLCLVNSKMTPQQIQNIRTADFGFNIVLTAESLVRLFAMGPVRYFRNGFNTLAFFITITTFITMIITLTVSIGNGGWITALRSIRLLRIVYFTSFFPLLASIWRGIVRCVVKLVYLLPLVLLVWFVFAVMGKSLFQGKFYGSDGVTRCSSLITFQQLEELNCPRRTWDNIGESLFLVFQISTGENWPNLMYDAMNAAGIASCVFFVLCYIVLVFIMLGIFLSFILIWFTHDESSPIELWTKITGGWNQFRQWLKRTPRSYLNRIRACHSDAKSEPLAEQDRTSPQPVIEVPTEKSGAPDSKPIHHFEGEALNGNSWKPSDPTISNRVSNVDTAGIQDPIGIAGSASTTHTFGSSGFKLFSSTTVQAENERSCFGWLFTNPIHGIAVRINESIEFEVFVDLIILFSLISFAVYTPNIDAAGKRFTQVSFYIILSSFGLEMVVKVAARGVLFPKNGYLRKFSDWVELFVMVCMILVAALYRRYPAARILLLAMLLRSTALFRIIPGMKAVGQTLVLCAWPSLGVTIIVLIIYLIFALWGLFMFVGRYYLCDCSNAPIAANCDTASIARKPDAASLCVAMGGAWIDYPSNFDSILMSFSTLFETLTLENWVSIMDVGQDSCGRNVGGEIDCNRYASLYFVLFAFIGSMFCMSLYISVVVDSFVQGRESRTGLSFLTEPQKQWVEWQKALRTIKIGPIQRPPRRNTKHRHWSNFRLMCFNASRSPKFGYFLDFVALGNSVLMCLQWYPWPDNIERGMLAMAVVFTLMFILEFCLVVIGTGFHQSFRTSSVRMHVLRAIVIASMIADCVFRGLRVGGVFYLPADFAPLFILLNLRLFLVLRLLRHARKLQKLVVDLWLSLPTLINVGIVLGYLFYIFAILGVVFFATIPVPVPDPPLTGGGVETFANFRNFPLALLTLIRCSTGESWNSIMWDIRSLGGAYNYSYFYFYSFMFLSKFLLTNLFAAMVIEMYSSSLARLCYRFNATMLDDFLETWKRLDPFSTGFISAGRDLRMLLRDLNPPMGLGEKATTGELFALLDEINDDLHMDETDHTVYFSHVLYALVKHMYKQEIESIPENARRTYRQAEEEHEQTTRFVRNFKTLLSRIADRFHRTDELEQKRRKTQRNFRKLVKRYHLHYRHVDMEQNGANGQQVKHYMASKIIQDFALFVLQRKDTILEQRLQQAAVKIPPNDHS